MKKIFLSIGGFLIAFCFPLTSLAAEKNGIESIIADSKELRTKLLSLGSNFTKDERSLIELREPEAGATRTDFNYVGHYTNERIRKKYILQSSPNTPKNIHLNEERSNNESLDPEGKDYKNDQKDCQYLDYVNGIGNTIYLKPGFVTDIMLPEGERLEQFKLGDKLRYEVETFFDRNGRGRWHIYIQPLVWDITTNIIIVTDRHIFQSALETSEMFIPFVKWELAEDDKEDLSKAENVVLPVKSPSELEFDYSVTGKAARRIQRCFDDRHWNTFIVFKKDYLKNKKPIVFASSSNGSLVLTDYETNGDTIVVHNVFSILEIHIGNSVAVIRRRKSI